MLLPRILLAATDSDYQMILTTVTWATYTPENARDEGLGVDTSDNELGGSAASRTTLDREAVFFCAERI